MSTELYKKYRPQSLKTVIGQERAVASLQKLMDKGDIPHAILLTGPSGCGKTTVARILKNFLDCSDNDFVEVNCADFKGIDMVRDIRKYAGLSPLGGGARVWLIDECHKLTGDAQNAFLKLLEDTPRLTYFILATTDPQKLLKTVITRCTEIKLAGMSEPDLAKVVQRVIDKEGLTVSAEVIAEIVSAADFSARKALVLLEQVGSLEGDKAQLDAITATSFNKGKAIDLAREIMFGQPNNWLKIAGLLRDLAEDEPEGIRYLMLGYARSCMVGSKDGKPPNPRFCLKAFKVIDIFSKNFYDSKAAGLAAACWEASQ